MFAKPWSTVKSGSLLFDNDPHEILTYLCTSCNVDQNEIIHIPIVLVGHTYAQ